MVIKGAFSIAVCVDRISCRWKGQDWVLNEDSAAVKHELGRSAVQCDPQAPPEMGFHIMRSIAAFIVSNAASVGCFAPGPVL